MSCSFKKDKKGIIIADAFRKNIKSSFTYQKIEAELDLSNYAAKSDLKK